MVRDLEKMCTKVKEATVAVQMVKVKEKALVAQAEDLETAVQRKSEAILNASKAAEALWRGSVTAVEVSYAVKRRTALAKL